MTNRKNLITAIQNVTPTNFETTALTVFQYQAKQNLVYRQFLNLLKIDPLSIQSIRQIPFLPIQLFKTHSIKSGNWTPSTIFTSSGTTGQTPSQHPVKNLSWYQENTIKGFQEFYPLVTDMCILALLPSYLERQGSSLIEMAQHFIQCSKYKQSGFFLYNVEELTGVLRICKKQGIPTLLIGVSFALLDLAEQHQLDLEDIIVMETGGMKGRRKEITRTKLHQQLKKAFNLKHIHSEYGMTELLSQAYSKGNGIFQPTATMKILIREITDPFCLLPFGRTGCLNIIDLANIDSCAFIATDDLGKVYEDGSFEVLGRIDASDIRGCNLMIID